MSEATRDALGGRAVPVGALRLWVDEVGPADGEPVVLVAAADTPGFRWPAVLVDALVGAGYRVVRFDHRDSGRSSWLPDGTEYALDDLAADAVALLDVLGLGSAHWIGQAMGGMVAQVVALGAPERVRSLTLIATSPGVGDERLPGPDEAFVEAMTPRIFSGPPVDDAERIAWITDLARLLAGPRYPFAEDVERAAAAAELATGRREGSGHGHAIHASPSRLDRLAEIDRPTLVVHGTADPVFPVEHGRMLAARLGDAVHVEVEGLGHEAPAALFVDLLDVLLGHLARATRP